MISNTFEAATFGPHVKFWTFLAKRTCAIIKMRATEIEEDEICRKTLGLKIGLCSFLAHNSSKEVTPRSPIIGQYPYYWTTRISLGT
jgi:hypothetical protein